MKKETRQLLLILFVIAIIGVFIFQSIFWFRLKNEGLAYKKQVLIHLTQEEAKSMFTKKPLMTQTVTKAIPLCVIDSISKHARTWADDDYHDFYEYYFVTEMQITVKRGFFPLVQCITDTTSKTNLTKK